MSSYKKRGLYLTFWRMFKTAIYDRPQKFWFEKEVSETRAVDTDVRPFDVLLGWLCCSTISRLKSRSQSNHNSKVSNNRTIALSCHQISEVCDFIILFIILIWIARICREVIIFHLIYSKLKLWIRKGGTHKGCLHNFAILRHRLYTGRGHTHGCSQR